MASLGIAIAIPFITFTTYIEAAPVNKLDFLPVFSLESDTLLEPVPTNYLPLVLWSIYGLGVLIFSLKFGINLYKIVTKVRQNPKFKSNHIINVLLQDMVTPHTFFQFIFLNKRKFESGEIPPEVILHEETHAKQKHSLDILFIEFIQIIFWFNPLIYFLKHTIKLNHEFLADQAVIKRGTTSSNYQQILLAFSSNAKYPELANAINYSSIKKRFTVMKTKTTKRTFWLRSFLLLPLLGVLIYSFSSKEIVEKSYVYAQNISQEEATKKMISEYNVLAKKYNKQSTNKYHIKYNEVNRLKYIYGLMTDKQKKNAEPFPNFPPPPPTSKSPKVVSHSDLPPPPPIPANATEEEKVAYNKTITNYKNKNAGLLRSVTKENGEIIEVIEIPNASELPPPPPSPIVKKGEKSNIPPPSSPAPKKKKL